MELVINANICDRATREIADVLRTAFAPIRKELSKDYGGIMEHLWIDFELIQDSAPYRFRFQKRGGGSSFTKLTGLPAPVTENVGHYSVSPDFPKLLGLPIKAVADYALSLIYDSTSFLIEKQTRLGGFVALRFRADFLAACNERGYPFAQISRSP